jgi:hypothetical protein
LALRLTPPNSRLDERFGTAIGAAGTRNRSRCPRCPRRLLSQGQASSSRMEIALPLPRRASILLGVAPRARDAKVALGSPSPMVRQKQARRAQQSCARQSDRSSPGSTTRRSTSDPQAYNRPQTPVQRQDKSAAQPRAQRATWKSLTGAIRRCGDYGGGGPARPWSGGGSAAPKRPQRTCATHRRDGGPTPACPQKEAAAHSAQPNAYPL